MLHCSHCLIHCEPDRIDDFFCCSGCGKVLGQFFGGKYIDYSKLLLVKAAKLERVKEDIKRRREKKKVGMNYPVHPLAT